ncbi:hypothetical protein E2C01_006191 [Portunus trituberculatus]|uniref:Uncharacterized protein n=1 Tax=Portunus trituberculatus TaxID=210409 RepID=A0A5B7CUH0_PORTR|nr:hypothetical protein [Portunus trituberculatus]
MTPESPTVSHPKATLSPTMNHTSSLTFLLFLASSGSISARTQRLTDTGHNPPPPDTPHTHRIPSSCAPSVCGKLQNKKNKITKLKKHHAKQNINTSPLILASHHHHSGALVTYRGDAGVVERLADVNESVSVAGYLLDDLNAVVITIVVIQRHEGRLLQTQTHQDMRSVCGLKSEYVRVSESVVKVSGGVPTGVGGAAQVQRPLVLGAALPGAVAAPRLVGVLGAEGRHAALVGQEGEERGERVGGGEGVQAGQGVQARRGPKGGEAVQGVEA